MTTYDIGTVVLVAFPMSGTGRSKKRPALVVLDTGDDDVVLAPITSRAGHRRGDIELRDWSAAGLLRRSWARLAKISCLAKADVLRALGAASSDDLLGVSQTWRELYRLCMPPTEET